MPKRQRWSEGSIFLVPLGDGRWSVGQVLRRTPKPLNSVICAFYDLRRAAVEVVGAQELKSDRLISIQFTTPDLLNNGTWLVVGQGPALHLSQMTNLPALEARGFIGARVIGSGIIQKFLDAFYGLRPWDDWADPHYLDGLLLTPDRKPKNIVLSRGV